MKKIYSLLLFISTAGLYAQNPIVPAGVYIADPSAHVWNDGKLYIYGSRDESPDYYCSWSHHVLSTSDLKTWTIHENAFASKGEGDQVSYSDDFLYAPDAQYKNGIYYLYYCLANNTSTEGVAISKSPVGPFTNGKKIYTGGINQIDPCVFIDDDGQAYYIWGQFTAKMAKLKPNMTEIDTISIKDNIVTEKEHFFHEGGYLVKRKGIYYFIYAGVGPSGMPTCISYATAKSPFGPYKYGGIIVDNDHCDPGNWNNHGSIVEYQGKWYVFYHRATHGSYTMRKACVEPITFRADGSIPQVEMTSQGAGGPLDALKKVEAEQACLLHGNVRVQKFAPDQEELGGINNEDKAGYKYIDFGDGVESITVRVAPGVKGGTINFGIDNLWNWPAIASVEVPRNGDGKTWQEITVKVKAVKGVHSVWIRFNGEGSDLYKIDWFRFNKKI